ncbi:MAG TPA: ATP-dependent DNA ligase [Bacteroidia bacterium]|nr:ATP-dependent DNA ligase [Bacteroidia bacterium]
MKEFASLFTALDQTTKTNAKLEALENFFSVAPPQDKVWAVALLSHRRPRRPVNTTLLRAWAAETAGIPLWLFEESYTIVGDLSETITLLLPEPKHDSVKTLAEWMEELLAIGGLGTPEQQRERIAAAWMCLNREERFVFNKLITGSFRIGVSQNLVVQALARHTGLDITTVAHRITGNWNPYEIEFGDLLSSESTASDISKPYNFYLAYPLQADLETLGEPSEWFAERKWDGIRGQLIVREGQLFIWSRGEDLVTDKFPELHILANKLPNGTVIDGELLCFDGEKPLPFNLLQTRIGRKNVSKKTMEAAPVALIAYDLLEFEGRDMRNEPMQIRRKLLENVSVKCGKPLYLSPLVTFETWEELTAIQQQSREHASEGLMLKRKSSIYRTGRRRGDWWKWKIDPISIDAVMIYAMRGHGRRANLYTDYTFAVWDEDNLIPFTKAYSGLTDKEMLEVDSFVKRNTIEKFGPVRSVKPELVFEIGFEGIQKSTRHKSGVALRFPRILRWRKDKTAAEANTMSDLEGILNWYNGSSP